MGNIIREVQDVYTMQLLFKVKFMEKPLEGSVYFLASSDEELKELLNVYQQGGVDSRIIEMAPTGVFDSKFTVEYTDLKAPDGTPRTELFPSINWSMSEVAHSSAAA